MTDAGEPSRRLTARRLGIIAVGLAAVVGACRLGWAPLYVLGLVVAAVVAWRMLRHLSYRTVILVALTVLASLAILAPGRQLWALEPSRTADWQFDNSRLSGFGSVRYPGTVLIEEWLVDTFPGAIHQVTDGKVLLNAPRLPEEAADGYQYPVGTRGIAAVAPPHSVVLATPEGVRWEQFDRHSAILIEPADRDLVWSVRAVTRDAVVIAGCPEDQEEPPPGQRAEQWTDCRVISYAPDGSELWSREAETVPFTYGLSRLGNHRRPPDAGVVVTGAGPFVVRDLVTGAELITHHGTEALVTRDLVVSVESVGQECLMLASRGGDVRWQITFRQQGCDLSWTDGTVTVEGEDRITTVDLDTGDPFTHDVGRWSSQWITGFHAVVPMDADGQPAPRDVEEYSGGLVGFDLRTGEELWRSSKSYLLFPKVVSGGVTVQERIAPWNPYLLPSVRGGTTVLNLLDARSGKVLIRTLMSNEPEAASALPVPGGLATLENFQLSLLRPS